MTLTHRPLSGDMMPLKPCPMCGSTPRMSRRTGVHGTACKSRWMREMVACKCGLSITGKRPGQAVAVSGFAMLWMERK